MVALPTQEVVDEHIATVRAQIDVFKRQGKEQGKDCCRSFEVEKEYELIWWCLGRCGTGRPETGDADL